MNALVQSIVQSSVVPIDLQDGVEALIKVYFSLLYAE